MSENVEGSVTQTVDDLRFVLGQIGRFQLESGDALLVDEEDGDGVQLVTPRQEASHKIQR